MSTHEIIKCDSCGVQIHDKPVKIEITGTVQVERKDYEITIDVSGKRFDRLYVNKAGLDICQKCIYLPLPRILRGEN